jgi:hypothetical protein
LKFVETPRDDQSIPIGPDGKRFLHRLLQADSFRHEKVKTTDNGTKLSSKKVVQENNDNILEGENVIKVAMKTPSTGGNTKIQRSMQAQPTKAKAEVSTKVKSRKSLSRSY